MTEQRTPGKQWTTSEDEKLVQAVQLHGEDTENWKTIALAVPGRTNKACRKRWKHSLHPSIKKTPWDVEEDELLIKLHAQHPGRWALIATHIHGRTDDACAKRYREALDPNLKKDDWTSQEDDQLVECYHRHGAAWGKVGEELGRSGLGCRNRWRMLERRKRAAERKTTTATSTIKKRKRPTSDEDDSDGEFSDEDTGSSMPGPSRRRTSSAARGTLDWPTAPATYAPSGPITLIDPSIIDMALGKCGCGCASGNKECNCSSTTPTLNFASDPTFIASLDWNLLFPYLQAELPSVFVEPPLLNQSSTLDFSTVQSVLDKFSRLQGGGCGCGSEGGASGCCSAPSTSDTSPTAVPATGGGCCSGNRSTSGTLSCCGDGSSTMLNRPSHPENPRSTSVDAEAAILVLDWASGLQQRQQQPSPAPAKRGVAAGSLHVKTASSHSVLCQTPASLVLKNIIEHYQQQRSNPSSNATSNAMSSIPLPLISTGCGCGCGVSAISHSMTQDLPTQSSPSSQIFLESMDNISEPRQQTTKSCCGEGTKDAVIANENGMVVSGVYTTPLGFASTLGPTTLQVVPGSCCGGGSNAETAQIPITPAYEPSPAFLTASEPIQSLPDYIPGCGCGCAPGNAEGSCTCGCIGICFCGASSSSQAVVAQPVLPPSPPHEEKKSCCSKPMPVAYPSQQVSSPFLALAMAAAEAEAKLPTYIPGCGCGCAADAPAGNCSCGCVGVCSCASAGDVPFQPLPTPRSPFIEIPSVVPGCGCGCNSGVASASANDCSCGCVGVCQCGREEISENRDIDMTWSGGGPAESSSPQQLVGALSGGQFPDAMPLPSSPYDDDGSADPSPLSSGWAREAEPKATTRMTVGSKSKASHSRSESATHHRLSALLGAPLPAYACGHPDCWLASSEGEPVDSIHGSATERFNTSGELMDHRRNVHGQEDECVGRGTGPSGGWLYRCGLVGCEKGWKSINGIQYHLQLSKAHFAPADGAISERKASESQSPRELESSAVTKPFKCPHAGCSNSYKQSAGLKYHLTHGHPLNRPVQFPGPPSQAPPKASTRSSRHAR